MDEELRARSRATWAAGNWDEFSAMIAPVGALVVERCAIAPGMRLLDVGTGSGGNVAIPAAVAGARVTGSDVTPEHFEHARRRAAEAGVEVEWVDADAQELPFEDAGFDRVTSTFGAMFAASHARAAAELVRVCAPGGRIVMTTWVDDGFVGEMFEISGSFLPPPPAGVEPPKLWGVPAHIEEMFALAGARPAIERATIEFRAPSRAAMVGHYASKFGPFVMARAELEPAGRWQPFLGAFAALIDRFNDASDGSVRIPAEYFVITVER